MQELDRNHSDCADIAKGTLFNEQRRMLHTWLGIDMDDIVLENIRTSTSSDFRRKCLRAELVLEPALIIIVEAFIIEQRLFEVVHIVSKN